MELEEIKTVRKKLELTQKELAKLAGVSQSLIAKIESEKIDPAYSKVRKISSALELVASRKGEKAADFVTRRVIFAGIKEKLTKAAERMRNHSISQLPVADRGKVVGLITETGIVEAISKSRNINELEVGEIMEEAPPSVPLSSPKELVAELLRYAPIVLVYEGGICKGVIAKADLLRKL